MLRKALFGLMIPLAVVGCFSDLENTLVYQPAPGPKRMSHRPRRFRTWS